MQRQHIDLIIEHLSSPTIFLANCIKKNETERAMWLPSFIKKNADTAHYYINIAMTIRVRRAVLSDRIALLEIALTYLLSYSKQFQ